MPKELSSPLGKQRKPVTDSQFKCSTADAVLMLASTVSALPMPSFPSVCSRRCRLSLNWQSAALTCWGMASEAALKLL